MSTSWVSLLMSLSILFSFPDFQRANLLHPSIVATDMGKAGFELLAKQGIDLSAHIISVEQSTNGIKNVIENASLESTNGKFLGPDGGELPW